MHVVSKYLKNCFLEMLRLVLSAKFCSWPYQVRVDMFLAIIMEEAVAKTLFYFFEISYSRFFC